MEIINEHRLEWLDAVKGLGILLVLVGHCHYESLTDYIYMFHMPFFFIISGFCWNSEKYRSLLFKDFFKKKFNSYIIPYLKVSAVCFLFYGLLYGIYRLGFSAAYLHQLLKYLYGIFIYSRGTTEWLPNCSPIWFLTCLFVAEILYWYVNKCDGLYKLMVVFSFGLVGMFFSNIVKLPWNIDNACSAVPLLYIGTIVRNHCDKILSLKMLLFFLMATIGVFKYGIKGGDFDGNSFPNFPLMYLQASVITFFVLALFRLVGGGKVLSFFGKNTLILIGYNYTLNFFISPFTGMGNIWMISSVILSGFVLIFITNKFSQIKQILI